LPRFLLLSSESKGSIGIKAKSIPLAGKKALSHCFNFSIAYGKEKIAIATTLQDEFPQGEFNIVQRMKHIDSADKTPK
jgi:hypothetical protein